MPERLLPFLLLSTLITVTPGPDIALGLRNGLRGGANAMWWTGIGCCSGLVVHATASIIGMSTLFAASPAAYAVLRTAGAAYLLWLGFNGLLGVVRTRRDDDAPPVPGAETPHPGITRRTAYRQGLVSNLLNPKIAVLFLTLLPQFVTPREPHTGTSLQLALAFIAVGLLWWRLTSWLFGRLSGLPHPRWFRPALEVATGTVLVGLGLRVAFTGLEHGVP
ncbi:LysE family translocator [Actinopolyspora erythraea]|uniref:Homoserine lactone transporter n=1 Tax=Actinopolyspora erythraea TaxID=414996 RepID=A0A099D3Z9_9ACTN|nr:LysE family translocator [Actinopolyspora erythraea]ASU77813.1 LysE family translocator [Actinopolyspora erythraea]KGI80030.1 homoserine lactone transporter [Actinopolyspora erythraea]